MSNNDTQKKFEELHKQELDRVLKILGNIQEKANNVFISRIMSLTDVIEGLNSRLNNLEE